MRNITKYYYTIYRCISDRFDVGKATAWRAVRRVVNAFYSFLHTFIKCPTREEAERTWNIVKDKCSFPKVIGAIDGTHKRIAAPKIHPEAYINRKGYHSIQLQVLLYYYNYTKVIFFRYIQYYFYIMCILILGYM